MDLGWIVDGFCPFPVCHVSRVFEAVAAGYRVAVLERLPECAMM